MKTRPHSRPKWLTFLLLTVAGVINALGVTLFLAPVRLYDSGVSGTSMLLWQVTPDEFTLSLFLLLLNLPIFLYGLKKQGKLFTVCSIYAVAIYSGFAYLITYILPIDVSASAAGLPSGSAGPWTASRCWRSSLQSASASRWAPL